jgi:DNA topoisomerase-1
MSRTAVIDVDPEESARTANLRHVTDRTPGIERRRAGKGFTYRDVDGRLVRDPAIVSRIRSLAIPPAWTSVWICPSAHGHIQATGRDAKGRKQYRYHPRWRKVRDETKYEKMIAFASALPGIRAAVERDLALPGLPREKVLATIVQLLEVTCIRVGNEEYARKNRSFGLTTLQNRHVDVSGSVVRFGFRGKSGKSHAITLQDRRLARVIARCSELPGHELFQYVDDEGEARSVESSDVNAYLKRITGAEFTAKDFRTWVGTVLAVRALRDLAPPSSGGQAAKHLVAAVKQVAERLGNTAAVCRNSYVHPAVLEAYLDGESWKKAFPGTRTAHGDVATRARAPSRRRTRAGARSLAHDSLAREESVTRSSNGAAIVVSRTSTDVDLDPDEQATLALLRARAYGSPARPPARVPARRTEREVRAVRRASRVRPRAALRRDAAATSDAGARP